MIGVLGHLRQQAGGRDALGDDVRGYRRLRDGFALGTRLFAPDVALDAEDARFVVQLLGHVLADVPHLAATAAGG